MAVRVISNPIINSPDRIPVRHFAFDNDGITDRIVQGRRESSYFVPVPRSRKRGVHQQHSHPITPCRPLLRKVTVPRYRDPTGDALNADSERLRAAWTAWRTARRLSSSGARSGSSHNSDI
jgi:type III restriction enzyme